MRESGKKRWHAGYASKEKNIPFRHGSVEKAILQEHEKASGKKEDLDPGRGEGR